MAVALGLVCGFHKVADAEGGLDRSAPWSRKGPATGANRNPFEEATNYMSHNLFERSILRALVPDYIRCSNDLA